MALIQCNVTVDIMLQNKGYAHIITVSATVLLIFVFWQYGVTPGECNVSQLFTLVQSFAINYYCQTIM